MDCHLIAIVQVKLFHSGSFPVQSPLRMRVNEYFLGGCQDTGLQTFDQDGRQSSVLSCMCCPSLPNQSVCFAKRAWSQQHPLSAHLLYL